MVEVQKLAVMKHLLTVMSQLWEIRCVCVPNCPEFSHKGYKEYSFGVLCVVEAEEGRQKDHLELVISLRQ